MGLKMYIVCPFAVGFVCSFFLIFVQQTNIIAGHSYLSNSTANETASAWPKYIYSFFCCCFWFVKSAHRVYYSLGRRTKLNVKTAHTGACHWLVLYLYILVVMSFILPGRSLWLAGREAITIYRLIYFRVRLWVCRPIDELTGNCAIERQL